MPIYEGINNVARKVSSMYIGGGGVAKKITNGFIGINSVARNFFSSSNILSYYTKTTNCTMSVDTSSGIKLTITKTSGTIFGAYLYLVIPEVTIQTYGFTVYEPSNSSGKNASDYTGVYFYFGYDDDSSDDTTDQDGSFEQLALGAMTPSNSNLGTNPPPTTITGSGDVTTSNVTINRIKVYLSDNRSVTVTLQSLKLNDVEYI